MERVAKHNTKEPFAGTLAFGSIQCQLLSLLGFLLFLFAKSRHPQVVVNRSGLKKCLGTARQKIARFKKSAALELLVADTLGRLITNSCFKKDANHTSRLFAGD